MPQHKPNEPSDSSELRSDNSNPRNSDNQSDKLSPCFSDRLFSDFGKRAHIEIVNRFAQESRLKPESNRANSQPPESGKADALGTGGDAHRCRSSKDSRHEAHENKRGRLLAACNNIIVKILDLE